MLDLFGTIAITATMVVVLNAVISTLPVRPRMRLGVALIIGIWVGSMVALGSSGAFADSQERDVPLIGLVFALPLILTGAFAIGVPAVRSALLAVPMPLLIGLNVTRVFGALFLLLAAEGRLGGPFPQSAGWGDVLTGIAALPIAWLAARSVAEHARAIGVWNAFGALDLVVAVVLGMSSANGSPLQLIDIGAGSDAVQRLPWALIPTVLVPFFLVTHAVVFAQLRQRVRGAARAITARAAH